MRLAQIILKGAEFDRWLRLPNNATWFKIMDVVNQAKNGLHLNFVFALSRQNSDTKMRDKNL